MVHVAAKIRRIVELRAGQRCEYCHAPQRSANARFHSEHFTPRSRGGTDELDNLNLSCITCNLAKGDAVTGIDPTSKERRELFNPRLHTWDEHFSWDADSITLPGSSPLGRATIATLKMNQPLQIEARPYWRILGLFP